MNNEIFERIKSFVERERWKYSFPLTRETTVEMNLKITGDDADEFLIAFSKEFNVDVSNFRIGDYFGDEGDTILPALIHAVTGKKKVQRKMLTIGDFEKAIINDGLN